MSYDASNVYTTASGSTTAFPGQVIASATWNSIFTDIANNGLTIVGQGLSRAGKIYCTAAGTNAITLTLANSFPAIPAYVNGQTYTFLAPASSSGAVTLRVGALSFLKVFLTNGTTQASTGDVISGQYYEAVYLASLDAAAGGFVVGGGTSSIFLDNAFAVVDNLDPTKRFMLQVSGVTTATTRTWTVPDFNDTFVGLTGSQVLTNKTLTSPDINGGTVDSLTSLSVRSTGAAFDVLLASNDGTLAANRTLNFVLNNGNRSISMSGDLTLAGSLTTSGASALTLTTTAPTNVTFPTTGTLATLAGVEVFTNKTLTSPTINTPTISGGTVSNVSLSLDNTATAFELGLVSTDATMSANRNLIFNTQNGTRTIQMAGDLTLGGTLITSGAFSTTLTMTAGTTLTLPTTGTLATLAGVEVFTNKTLTSPTINGGTHTAITSFSLDDTGSAFNLAFVSTVTGMSADRTITWDTQNGSRTITLAGNINTSGGFTTSGSSGLLTQTYTASPTVAFGSGGTVVYTTNNLSVFAATTSAQFFGVISDETGGAGVVVGNASPTFTTLIETPKIIGGTGTTSTLTLQPTSGVGTTNADIKFLVGNNGATNAMTIFNSGVVSAGDLTGSFSTPLLQVNASSAGGAGFSNSIWANNASGAFIAIRKSRGTAVGTNTVVQNSDEIGNVYWTAADGTNQLIGASIGCFIDGTPGTNDMPTRMIFSVCADGASAATERLRINNTGRIIAYNGTAIPAGGTAGLGYSFSSTADFGIYFGSGAPSLAAAKGSLYLRSDGSTTNDRAYINTNGSTTWTAITTVA